MSPATTSSASDQQTPLSAPQNGIHSAPQNGIHDKNTVERSSKAIVGQHEALAMAGQHMVDNLERLEVMNPSLGRHILENGFGGTTANAGFGYREWALHTMGVLTALGDCPDQLDVYLGAALSHGATEDEVYGVVNHASSFCGAPRAVNTMRRIKNRLLAAREFERPLEKVVRLSDHDTLVRDTTGSDIPIILVHALAMDGRMFQKIMPRLGCRVITYDLRGHGFARGAPLTKSLEHLADDLKELMDALNISKADIYGASYGGAVAQYFTLAHPGRVRSLCLMATSSQAHPTLLSRATRAEEGQMKELQTEAIIRWFRPETIADNTWAVRYARANVGRVRVKEWAAAWRAMARLDCLHLIPEIEVPMLVLAGTQDLSSTPERMKPIHEAAKNSSYVELNPGTHMMAMEQPEAVAKALKDFRVRVDASQ